MRLLLEFILISFIALFPVVDPVGGAPIFLVLTADASPKLRQHFAGRTALYVVLVLTLFLLVGSWILKFFGLSLAVVRIAGGIVIFHAAWHTMNAQPKITPRDRPTTIDRLEHHDDIALIPMTIPMLAGPGSIAVTLGLAAQAGRGASLETLIKIVGIAIAISLIGVVVYFSLRSSTLLLKVMGERGISALSRVLGLFIMAIGVQLILTGIADWLTSIGLLSL